MGAKSQANTSAAQRWPSQCQAAKPNWVRTSNSFPTFPTPCTPPLLKMMSNCKQYSPRPPEASEGLHAQPM